MNTRSSKVVSINSRDRGAGALLLNDCLKQLTEQLVLWLEGLQAPIQEELFELADSTSDRLKQTKYFDLRRYVERDWSHLVEAFRSTMLAPKTSAPVASASTLDFSSLSLVDDGDLSLRIVVREFATQLSESCDEELYALDRRVAVLLGQDEPAQGEDNPLSPGFICQALSEACQTLAMRGGDADPGVVLLRRLERHLHLVLPGIYRAINAMLISRGLLPDLKRTYRRAVVPRAPSAASGSVTGGGISPVAGDEPDGSDMLGTLQRLAMARGAVLSGALGGVAGQQIQTSAGMISAAMFPVGAVSAGAEGSMAGGLNPVFLSSLNSLQHAFEVPQASVGGNLVRQVRDSEAARNIGALESVTIDIVAMLFDFIFDAKDVPAAVKSLVGRLQIPVLKIAMIDASFFSNRAHPARHFLDEISGIALAWGDGVSENDPFYIKLQQLVERIQSDFETDVSVFGSAIAELGTFVAEHEAKQEEALAFVTQNVARREVEAAALEEAEQRAQQRAAAAFAAWQERGGNAGMPLLKAFYASYWRPVLERCALDYPGDDVADMTVWQGRVDVMDELSWSVVPKSSQEGRMHLISLLPTLLARLNAGLDTISVAKEVRSQFFDTLVQLHSAALRNQASAVVETVLPVAVAAVAPELVEEVIDASVSGTIVTRSQENGIEMEDVILASHSLTWCGNDPQAMQRVQSLTRGDWVEFVDEENVARRERLNWVSPQRGIMVFSNHGSAKAISISPEALAHMLKEGHARLLPRESLFERALENVVQTLNAAA